MLAKRKLLIVEDNAINRMMLKEILSQRYSVAEAENGQEALEKLEYMKGDVSLVLLDLVMPVMDGYTFLSLMKANPQFAPIPVIVTTQSGDEESEVRALTSGAMDFVAKPYKPQIIMRRIENIIKLRETAVIVNQFRYDRLTGLCSKEFFCQQARETMLDHPDREYDIVCSDIENFKLINDVFGVPAGDRLLCRMADTYRKLVGENGFCGRFSADRFACLVEHHFAYTDRVFRQAIDEINSLGEVRNVTVKWGIFPVSDKSLSIEQMCDRAFLVAKSIKGRYGTCFATYDDKLRNQLLREQAITDSMDEALEKEQFVIYLQPQYRLSDHTLVGAEALVRWNHPEWGLLPPAEFIPIFEKNGFIIKMDRYVWDRACAALKSWDEKGYPRLPVSVNVSRSDIYHADLADILIKTVRKYSLSPSRLHLEITESAYTENPDQLIETLGRLREKGFIIEMDDFGSGYSSLNMLNRMPLDVLKLDMKFIQDETSKPVNQGILHFVMELARWMKLDVVAEGVEKKEQITRLREMGCDYVQGYYYGKPMPCQEFDDLIKISGLLNRRELDTPIETREQPDTPLSMMAFLDILNSLPCGLCVCRVTEEALIPLFYNQSFYEALGMPMEQTQKTILDSLFPGVCPDDMKLLREKVLEAVWNTGTLLHICRVRKKDKGEYGWIHMSGQEKVQKDGTKLFYVVCKDISEYVHLEREFDRANEKLEHLVNSIPGGIIHIEIKDGQVMPVFFSDGIASLSGRVRGDLEQLMMGDGLSMIYEADRQKVAQTVMQVMETGGSLDVSYRIWHENGSLLWIRLNGRCIVSNGEGARLYAVVTEVSPETQLLQNMTLQTADGIYVIDKRNYDLLYVNDAKHLFAASGECVGKKCYKALQGQEAPCPFCNIRFNEFEGQAREMPMEDGRTMRTRFYEMDWNGIPAYVEYIQDITRDIENKKEMERLEQYFQTVLRYLPGGVAVVRYGRDGGMTPEFISDGFAAMTDMSLSQTWELYGKDATSGVHPEDVEQVRQKMAEYIESGEVQCEITYRLMKGDGSYVWVKNTLSIIDSDKGEKQIYACFRDMTREREEQEMLRSQYNDLIVQHYRTLEPNTLIVGHCNITQNRILEINDYTDSDLLETFGARREDFFKGISGFVAEPDMRRRFLKTYLNQPSLEAFEKGNLELKLDCFVRLPRKPEGLYARFKMNLIATPDSGDVTGILTVTDVTEQTVSDRILHKLSVSSYDMVMDVDLNRDHYTLLSYNHGAEDVPEPYGIYSEQVRRLVQDIVVPRDRANAGSMLDKEYMISRLKRDGFYSFPYSVRWKSGGILTKNLTVTAIDLRIGRICMARTDITDSVREQQGTLNIVASIFEVMGLLDICSGSLTMHDRRTILDDLPPYYVEDYNACVKGMTAHYGSHARQEAERQFRMETMLERLKEKPEGYDFVLPYGNGREPRYKQINILWGDKDHNTICMARADVTDILAAERQSKEALEEALAFAEEASRAKSDFLSSMSHDIRTPMNAIMGMTTLALSNMGDRDRLKDYLNKISSSSRHLLSLINDILDMSKIERSKITLNNMEIAMEGMLEQLSSIMGPQAVNAGLAFHIREGEMLHPRFYGDALRINQILINILGNAVKFTPEGGTVELLAEETSSPAGDGWSRYRFTVSDTGVGMTEEFLAHIFEPFLRNASRIEGTGLGLSITKGLVDLMGGSISVESRLNQGSVFCVELDLKWASAAGNEDREQPELPDDTDKGTILAGCRFLVAEDNAINSEILCEVLRMYGACFTVASNGARAVEAFKDSLPGTYDAVLMDIQMPEMNGYEATRVIRKLERPDAANIPIIAMTANAFAEDIQMARDAGMTAHVAKPIDLKVLLATLCGTVLRTAPLPRGGNRT